MERITENIETPITMECDCLIAGGGFAGISAALAAAREGASVILAEREFILGGLGTAGIVTVYLPICDGMGKQVSFGIAEELLRLSIKHGAEEKYPDAWLDSDDEELRKKQRFEVQYNPHIFALLAEKLLLDAGVKILYGTSISAVCVSDKKIDAVIVENKSGRSAIKVNKSVVDATGDAVVTNLSGASVKTFKMGNPLAAWHYSLSISRGYNLHMLGVSDSAEDIARGSNAAGLVPNRYSGLDGEELSEMMQTSHKFILDDILKKKKRDSSYIPVTIPTIPQIRMTRRIDGRYTMSDTEMHKKFEDSVGMFSDWRKAGPVYELPFSCLFGDDIKNLVCAGRCISVTDEMWDITRVIPVCAVSGEAAGTAAAMTDDFSEVNIKVLQDRLKKNGVVLHE